MAAQISPDSVWVLGAHMTRFARYPERDLIDLASESAMAALADGEVTVHDIDVLACGVAVPGVGRGGAAAPEADRPDRRPRLQRVERLRHRRHRHPHRDHGDQVPARPQIGLAVGVEQMGKMGLLGGGATKKDKKVFEPSGRFGAVTGIDGHLGTETMPGVFAQAGMAYAARARRRRVRAVRPGRLQEPSPLDAQPAGAVPEGVQPSTR